MKTQEELSQLAQQIAKAVVQTPVEQRKDLYHQVSLELRGCTQNFQASHFRILAQREGG